MLRVWKPLAGPLRDWPLALCDASTLDVPRDVVPTDIIFRNFIAENCMVHYSEGQRWHYLADQSPAELLVFKAADTSDPGFGGLALFRQLQSVKHG